MTIRKTILGTAAALAGLCFGASAVLANQHTEMPKPGAETKKLDGFAGKWKTEATMQPGPSSRTSSYVIATVRQSRRVVAR